MFLQYIINSKTISLTIILGIFINFGYAQLSTCVNTALKNNFGFRAMQTKTSIYQKDIVIAKSFLLPSLTFENNYFIANGGRKIAFASGDLINPIYSGMYQLTGNENYNVTIPNFQEQFYPDNFYRSALNLTWGIFRKNALMKYKSASKYSEINQIEQKLAKKKLIREVQTNYFEFYKLNKLIAFQASLVAYLKQLSTKTKKLVDHGFAEPIDLDQLQYELALQKEKQNNLESQYEILKQKFGNLLGEQNFTCSFPDEDADLNKFHIHERKLTSEQLTLKVYDLKEQVYNIEEKYQNNWIPDAGINLKTGFEGNIDHINSNEHFFYLGVINLNWILFEGSRNKHIKQQLSLKKDQNLLKKNEYLLNLELLIAKHKKNIANEKAALEILGHKKVLSKKILEHQKKKYLQGDLDIIDLLNFKTKYEKDVTTFYQNKISYIQHIIYYNWLLDS